MFMEEVVPAERMGVKRRGKERKRHEGLGMSPHSHDQLIAMPWTSNSLKEKSLRSELLISSREPVLACDCIICLSMYSRE